MTSVSVKSGKVLVAGGAGYIGAHTALALAEAGYQPVVYDNLSAGYREAVQWGDLVEGDIRDTDRLTAAMQDHGVSAVIHFASLIEVGRSSIVPDEFWDINVGGTASLLKAMVTAGVPRLVFSSTAAVYGGEASELLTETTPKDPASPYGDTKLACERMIAANAKAYGLTAVALRYFNAAGADPSGKIGEAHEPETHLIPLTIGTGLGRRPALTVFGEDFDTPDGTCVRDYIHVNDLADAHVRALAIEMDSGSFDAMNLGTGNGYSVKQVIETVGQCIGQPVPHTVGGRRAGDPPFLVANPSKARDRLGWTPTRSSLDNIVNTAISWHRNQKYSRNHD